MEQTRHSLHIPPGTYQHSNVKKQCVEDIMYLPKRELREGEKNLKQNYVQVSKTLQEKHIVLPLELLPVPPTYQIAGQQWLDFMFA